MKITLTFDNSELFVTERELRLLLADALYEFVSHRGPTTEEYVNRRYPNTPDYAWLNRKDKISEVNRRILIAHALHNQVWDIEIKD